MSTYRLDVEYDGTRFSGWQIQANARTVAGELQRALLDAGARDATLGGAGRTDAGVHALRQTAHVRVAGDLDPERLRQGLNDRLPPDIHVLGMWRATDSFHARHDAAARSYLYQISRRRSGLAKRFVWWVKRPLETAPMRQTLEALVGRHDCRLLCEAPSKQPSTIVVVDRVEMEERGDLILVRLVASHFLWKMVRRVIGAMVRAGTGELTLAEWRALLSPGDAVAGTTSPVAAWTAPPSGLFLERVVYPGEPALAPLDPVLALREPPPGAPYLGAGGSARVADRGDRAKSAASKPAHRKTRPRPAADRGVKRGKPGAARRSSSGVGNSRGTTTRSAPRSGKDRGGRG